MENIHVERTTFDKLKFPNPVYKYRKADVDYHRTIITEQIAYYAAPETFEDKLDCNLPTRYDLLTYDEAWEYYYSTLLEMNEGWDEFYLRQQVTLMANQRRWENPVWLDHTRNLDWEELNKRFGIFCLTANPANLFMWNEYADNFNGFCLGFNSKEMFKNWGGGGQVSYVKELPILKAFEDFNGKYTKMIYSKLDKFRKEQEYRTHFLWDGDVSEDTRRVKIPKMAFTEIIIGEKVEPLKFDEIVEQSQKVNPSIVVKIATKQRKKVIIKDYDVRF